MMRIISTLLLLLLGFSAQAQTFLIRNATIPEAPPMADVMVAYMNLQNTGSEPIDIIKISSPDFEQVQIHKTVIENDISKMIQQDHMSIEPGGTVNLQAGGMHLMLINPKKQLYQKDTVLLLLSQSDGTEHAIEVTVSRRPQKATTHHH